MSDGIKLSIKKVGTPAVLAITGGTVTQEETRQIKQYSPNKYTTQYSFSTTEPVALTDLASVAEVNRQANVLMGLATIVNRKSELRDGLNPVIAFEQVSESVPVGQEQQWAKSEISTLTPGNTSGSTAVVVNENDLMEVRS